MIDYATYCRIRSLRQEQKLKVGQIESGETIVEESWRFEIPFSSGAFSSTPSH